MKKPWIALTFTMLALISTIGDYAINVVGSLNWDIVLMLTPYGLIRFYLIPGHYLEPYFAQKTPLAAIWEQPQVLICIFALVVFALLALERIRLKK